MESLSPAQVTDANFRTIRKGYDPDEVDAFLADVAKALESARQQATAMEARARAAVARLQEASSEAAQPASAPQPSPPPEPKVEPESPSEPELHIPRVEAETISRTLLLAQKTADDAVAEAKAEAERIVAEATSEAESTLDSTRSMSAQMLEEARAEARLSSQAERQAAENEVEALVARREFLVADVDQLERFLIDQRDRLRGAAHQIEALCDRVPEGLGQVRPPVLSASNDDDPLEPTQELARPDDVGHEGASVGAGPRPIADDGESTDEVPNPAARLADALEATHGESGLPRR